jgi:peptidoglycan/LPS O-acetylase OafA/YrhL
MTGAAASPQAKSQDPVAGAARRGKIMFDTFNGIRGVAAILIAFRHCLFLFPGWVFPNSYLAVDLFFVLSGFVIANAYEQRLAGGLSPGGFMQIRLDRLYPLYALGLALGIVSILLTWALGLDARWSGGAFLISVVLGTLLLPTLHPWNDEIFPFNPPSWSLFFELLINYLYARTYRFMSARRYAVVVAIFAVVLFRLHHQGKNLGEGHSWDFFFDVGVARVVYCFTVGLVLFRLPRFSRTSSWLSALILVLVAATLMTQTANFYFPLIAVTLWLPMLVLAAANIEPGAKFGMISRFLGRISYPLYMIHAPIAVMVGAIITRAGIVHISAWAGVGFLATMVVLAAAADRYYDRIVRGWLARRAQRKAAASAEPAGAAVGNAA